MRHVLAVLLVLSSSYSVYAGVPADPCMDRARTIEEKLSCIPGMQFKEEQGAPQGMRRFEIQFRQPTDHANPSAGNFDQRLVLLHRDTASPVVLHTSGYGIHRVAQAALTSHFHTNQIQVEHRFFMNSAPAPLDWSKLNIKQSADDFHAITVAFRKIYPMRWVGTGGSKGGMTSVFHRRFYPDDLDGTVADVAPLSFSTNDERYNDFLNDVGGETYRSCRENWKKLQVSLLKNRDRIVPSISGVFSQLGGEDIAFEHSVIEAPFYFWQYGNPDDLSTGCKALPLDASFTEQFTFLQKHAAIQDYTDESIGNYRPYYFQAATELGSPDNITAHLEVFRRFLFSIDQYAPKEASYTYSNAAMRDVDQWVRRDADRILFVYGEYDPWSAAAFPQSETGKEIHRFVVPRGNHSAKFTDLAPEDKAAAIETLSRWLNRAPLPEGAGGSSKEVESLEDIEFRERRGMRI